MSARIVSDLVTVDVGAQFALTDEWRALGRSLPYPVPFHDPAWHANWWRHLSRDDLRRRDAPRLLTARSSAGRLVGVAPLVTSDRPGRGPAALRSAEFVGADKNLTEIRGPVVHPDYEAEVVTAWLRHLDSAADWDVLVWSGIRDLSPTHKLLAERSGVWWGFTRPIPTITLPDSYDEYRAGLSRNTKEALRKCRNSASRAGLDFNLVIHEGSIEPPVIDRFLALHWERSIAPSRVLHRDSFGAPSERAFLRSIVAETSLGAIVFELQSYGRTVASRIAFRLGNDLCLYYSGYATDHAEFSVMTTLFDLSLRWAFDAGIETVNLSPGMDRSKARWRPDVVDCHEAMLCTGSFRSRTSNAIYERLVEFRQRQFGGQTRGGATPAEWMEGGEK